MVSVQNIRQQNQSQTGIYIGFDETLKLKTQQIVQQNNQCLTYTLAIKERYCYAFPIYAITLKLIMVK